jgi:uncharacterized protein DUF5329
MTRLLTAIAALSVLLLRPAISPGQDEMPEAEREKVEALIKYVEDLKDAKFVRNDVEYDAKTAVTFLRGKWKSNEDDIHTARDFIEIAASTSSTTGMPYLIRFSDGREVKCADQLLAELKKLESTGEKHDP